MAKFYRKLILNTQRKCILYRKSHLFTAVYLFAKKHEKWKIRNFVNNIFSTCTRTTVSYRFIWSSTISEYHANHWHYFQCNNNQTKWNSIKVVTNRHQLHRRKEKRHQQRASNKTIIVDGKYFSFAWWNTNKLDFICTYL